MKVGRVLRVAGPAAFGLLLLLGPRVPAAPAMQLQVLPVEETGILWLMLAAVALVRWPRLWVLALNVVAVRIAMSFGEVAWSGWVDWGGWALVGIPLLFVGITSAFRWQAPGASRPRGHPTPNAEGIGALTVMVMVVPLLFVGRHGAALGVTALATTSALAWTIYTGAPAAHRGVWASVLGGMLAGMGYALYWTWPDWEYGRALAVRTGPVAAVTLWACLRALLPGLTPGGISREPAVS